MIKIIYGPKGFGKTKIIIDEANSASEKAKGDIVFITDTKKYMYDLKRAVRFVDVSDYNIKSIDALLGLMCGIAAGNGDLEYIFLDGAARIAGLKLSEMKDFYSRIEKLVNDNNLKAVLTVSAERKDIPDFIAKYIK